MSTKKKVGQFERGARESVLEDLFYDFNRSKTQIYWMNFVRGMFFGVGSIIGATILVAFAVSILGNFTDVPGGIGDFIKSIIDRVDAR